MSVFFFFQAEDGIRDLTVTGVQTCALPISPAVALEMDAYRAFCLVALGRGAEAEDRKSTRLNSSHSQISYAVFCLKKKITKCMMVDAAKDATGAGVRQLPSEFAYTT